MDRQDTRTAHGSFRHRPLLCATAVRTATGAPHPGPRDIRAVPSGGHPEKVEIARALRHDVDLYACNQDHIVFEPFLGTENGVLPILQSGHDNTFDQAVLMRALLHTCGYDRTTYLADAQTGATIAADFVPHLARAAIRSNLNRCNVR